MERKITFMGVLTEGFGIGLKNVVPLILSCLLWIVTIWIPYINVGTTIAISTIPLQLSRGTVINPLFIFEAKYRQYMGEYLILMGLMGIAMSVAAVFFFVPAMVISVAWSLAVLLMLDKGISPLEAIMQSNKATYGYKWLIFGVGIALAVAALIAVIIVAMIPAIGFILILAVLVLTAAISLSCSAVIYRDLTKPCCCCCSSAPEVAEEPAPAPAPAPEPEPAPAPVAEEAPAPKKVDDDNPFSDILNS